jgi:polar amino acid transport system substrate-binding protein
MRLLKTLSVLSVLIGLLDAAHAQSCTSKVPASSLIEAGKWQMSINPTLPPQQFVDDKGELQGLNVDLAKEIAKRICLEPVFLRMDFPPMIPALRGGRFDTINTGLFWTDERSKMLFLVPYAQQAISVYTDPKSDLKLEKFEDLAGRPVGVEAATYTERKAREFNAEMVAKGLKPIDLHKGIAKIWLRDIAGTDITFAFRDKALAQAAADALTAIRADGTYDKLFEKFGMTRLKTTIFAIRGDGPSN